MISGEILIKQPVELVFDYVADQRNEPNYNPQMLRSEMITDAPIRVGTRFRATARSGRREVEMLIEVTNYERPRRFGSRTTMSSADVDGGLTFEPVDGTTRMSWSWDVRPKGLPRFLAPLVALLGRRQEQTIWTALKNQLEGPSRADKA
jgi:polyketide cyclase/dehydrase/lipid transport protein